MSFSSGSSVYNVCAEEEEDGESCAAAQQSLENSITMNKMKLLKAKMEDMNLNKKVGITASLLKFYCALSANVFTGRPAENVDDKYSLTAFHFMTKL